MIEAWTFERRRPAPEGGFYVTDGEYSENFVRGVRQGASTRTEARGWVETMWGDSQGFVYFMGIGKPYITHVKIGYTTDDPEKRLAGLQTGCPFKIELLGFVFGTPCMESELHDVLKFDRVQGEWFVFTDYVEKIIRDQLEGDMFA